MEKTAMKSSRKSYQAWPQDVAVDTEEVEEDDSYIQINIWIKYYFWHKNN